jgi:2-iminobutanoate/2-iminopropanoate deaminase
MATTFNPPGIWQPFGAFCLIKIQGAGRIVHLKGQVSLGRDGEVVGRGDMRAQVRRTLENIQTALQAAGGEMADILSLTQHTTDIEQFMDAGDIRKQFFREPFPVTTTVEVVRLYHPELIVEITAIAEIPIDRFREPQATMHAP